LRNVAFGPFYDWTMGCPRLADVYWLLLIGYL